MNTNLSNSESLSISTWLRGFKFLKPDAVFFEEVFAPVF